jgi:hypothetical protein
MRHATLPETAAPDWRDSITDDRAEQLVADLALVVLSCHLRAIDTVRTYLAQASECARTLSSHVQTVRSGRPSKFARIRAAGGGATEILLIPIIGGAVSVPPVDLRRLVSQHRDRFDHLPSVDLSDVEIAYFTLRIRTVRVVDAIVSLDGVEDMDRIEFSTKAVLNNCLQKETSCPNPLDAADDYFDLACSFVAQQQAPLAALCLNKARSLLESYAGSSRLTSHLVLIDNIKERLGEIRSALTARAS